MNTGRGLEHMRFDAPSEAHMTNNERSRKVKDDFITYVRADFAMDWIVSRLVHGYRLQRADNLSPFEVELLRLNSALFPKGTIHHFI